jgi:hypothetical protein
LLFAQKANANIDSIYRERFKEYRSLNDIFIAKQNSLSKLIKSDSLLIKKCTTLQQQDSSAIYDKLANAILPENKEQEKEIEQYNINIVQLKKDSSEIVNQISILKQDSLNKVTQYQNQVNSIELSIKNKIELIKSIEQQIELKKKENTNNLKANQLQQLQDEEIKLNAFIKKGEIKNIERIKEIILTSDFAIEKLKELEKLKESIVQNVNSFNTLLDSIQKFETILRFINSAKSSLNKAYDRNEYINIKKTFPNVTETYKLFTQDQNNVIDNYTFSLTYYCKLYNDKANSINPLIENVIKNNFSQKDIELLNNELGKAFDDQYTYLKNYIRKLQNIVNKKDFVNLKSEPPLTNTNCINNEN